MMRVQSELIVLIALITSFVAAAQKAGTEWKEYVFSADNFAVTAPYAPSPHPDIAFKDATAYTVNFPNTDDGVTLRVMHEPHDCGAYLGALKSGVQAGKQPGADPSSLKDISFDGHPGVQYEWRVNQSRIIQERYYCINNHFYAFFIDHPKNRPLSAQVTRLISSLRLLANVSGQK
jgi:hypothetical protein